MVTAKKAGLRLLGSLPLEPDIVLEGDNGTVNWMEQKDLPYTVNFTKIIDEVKGEFRP
ncbi:unnamed protein product, partial [marine sediment metagenome]